MLRISLRAVQLTAVLFTASSALAQGGQTSEEILGRQGGVQYRFANQTVGEAYATDANAHPAATTAGTASCSDSAATTGGSATCSDCASSCGCKSVCDNFCNNSGCDSGCGCNSSCSCGCCNTCRCAPTWTFKAGALIMERGAPQPNVLVEDTVDGTTLANARNFNFNWAAGVDISGIRRIGDCHALEVRYFGIDGWRATQNFTTSEIWNFPTNPPLFGLGLANIDAVYTSRLYNAEINLRHKTSDRVQWLLGFRWMELHENLDFNADFGGNEAVVNTNTDNHLYGGQIGTDIRFLNGSKFFIDGIFKAGVYGNASDNTFGVTQELGPAFGTGQYRGQLAFVGEIGLTAAYQMTSHVALRGGYQLLWIDGVALASDQFSSIDVVTGNGIDSRGDVFYHGAMMSVDFTW